MFIKDCENRVRLYTVIHLPFSASGQLYMWGSGSEGQLGLGIAERELPTHLKFRSKVVSVVCGYYHTAVVTGTCCFTFSFFYLL